MESIWSRTTDIDERPSLQENIKAEAVVIGGGLAGILTAYFLQERGVDTVVLEAARIASGQTKNTTAKITSQHDLIYYRLLKERGEHQAWQYAAANQKAITDYRRIIQEQQIDCSLEEKVAYLYSQSPADLRKLEQEVEAAKIVGIPAEITDCTELPFPAVGLKFPQQAQFHPLHFVKAIAKNLRIYEQTRVATVEDNRVLTEHGTVTAKYIIFATHYPFLNLPGYYFARMHQERSYVLALDNAVQLNGMYLGVDSDGLSLRNYGATLLFGGGNHRTGENSCGGKYQFLRDKASQFFPQSRESAFWSAQDCMPLDGIPYIGQFAASTPNWFVATGFGKWGMTSSMVAANLIADRICRVDNPYAEVFSPSRFTPSASVKNFMTEIGQAVKGLSRQIFSLPDATVQSLPIGHGGIIEHDGEKIGAYKDDNGAVHLVSVICPHLGCQLEWNPDEKSWDCPCHGSRFDYTGQLLDNPAQNNIPTISPDSSE